MLRCILCALWKGMSLVDTFFVLAGMVLSTNVEMLLVSFAGMGCVLSLHVVMHSVLAALGRLGQHMLRFNCAVVFGREFSQFLNLVIVVSTCLWLLFGFASFGV